CIELGPVALLHYDRQHTKFACPGTQSQRYEKCGWGFRSQTGITNITQKEELQWPHEARGQLLWCFRSVFPTL
ncbi:MAG: hypothetical protein AAF202_14270, partial [Pseudomonadota bacterium]